MFEPKLAAQVLLATAISLISALGMSHDSQTTTSAMLEARREFQQDRFGMFIHWGIYSVLCDGEWVMNDKKIPITDYEKIARFFDPADFKAEEWVTLAKVAGMKYITFTTKHHDGFAMWDSQ